MSSGAAVAIGAGAITDGNASEDAKAELDGAAVDGGGSAGDVAHIIARATAAAKTQAKHGYSLVIIEWLPSRRCGTRSAAGVETPSL